MRVSFLLVVQSARLPLVPAAHLPAMPALSCSPTMPAASQPALHSAPQSNEDDDEFKWDAVFLDEGHKCKNPKTKQYQALQTLPAGLWVVVTGTPIQNNLMELHALFDLCNPGLLGDKRDFKQHFEKQIMAGHDRCDPLCRAARRLLRLRVEADHARAALPPDLRHASIASES